MPLRLLSCVGRPTRPREHIRWMLRRDMLDVLDIEMRSFDFPWSGEDFSRCLRRRRCIGMVAEQENRVVAFVIYEQYKTRLHLLNFAVFPAYRRRGIGTQMIETLIGKLTQQRRKRLVVYVSERNLGAQLFFRTNGFRAVSVLRGWYDDTAEDAYLMEWTVFANMRS